MSRDTSEKELAAIIDSLKTPPGTPKLNAALTLFQKIAGDGWASFADIEDIFYLTDERLDSMRHAIDVKRWCDLFNVPSRSVFSRPKANQIASVGYERMQAADVAELLIELERLGYSIDPEPLVALLLPEAKKSALITGAQLSVLGYKKTRHKCEAASLHLRRDEWAAMGDADEFVTSTHYRVEVWLSKAGTPLRLCVHAPKFRRRPSPRRETCVACGYEWMRGDPESSASHRREHKERLAYFDPKPLQEVVEEIACEADPTSVDAFSPRWKHREMYRRALAFKREFHYDFIQWHSPKGDDDLGVEGVLFLNEKNIIVGACAFRLRNDGTGKTWHGLQWIWIAPKYRRSGILSIQWPILRKRFGDFHVEGPVSDAMQDFLVKMGDDRLMSLQTILASDAPTASNGEKTKA